MTCTPPPVPPPAVPSWRPGHRMRFTCTPSAPAEVRRWVAAHLRRSGRQAPDWVGGVLEELAATFPRVFRVVCWPAGARMRVHLESVEAPSQEDRSPGAVEESAAPDVRRPPTDWGRLPGGGWWLEAPTRPAEAAAGAP